MIEKQTAFKVGDQLFATVEAAQRHSLITFLKDKSWPEPDKLADTLLSNKAHIIDLLTMKATSHPKARAANGGTKKRKPKPEPQQTLPGTSTLA